ncbi:hypothetical protein [Streptomyces sp. NPDC055287]
MRFLEIRRTGREPQPADFDHDFPALIARTLSDLPPDERHILRSVALLDAFDLALATRVAGTAHEAPTTRLIERPFVRENPFGLWPYHLHGLIRSTVRNADDQADDRWSPRNWQQAAGRALSALGEQWTTGTGRDRILLVSCLRQGLNLARDFRLELGWLAEAAWSYVSDSVWEPLAPPAGPESASTLETAADALVELLSALARRQHEHRERAADRLAAVTGTGLLPADLHEMAVCYSANIQRDLGRSEASRRGMQLVADGGGRLAPVARRGLAHLARLAGDFPTAYDTARTLGWEGRHHRVGGDIWWPHGDVTRSATAYEAARLEAEQHGVVGEHATSQAQRAFVLAFTNPERADDEVELARHLITGLNLRQTGHTIEIATLVRDAGTQRDLEDRARILREEIHTSGITHAAAALELAMCFHHAVLDNDHAFTTAIARLRDLPQGGDHAYYVDTAHFMADLSPNGASGARWLDGEQPTRNRWRTLVTARREYLRNAR